jgi:hypothetical protein
MNDTCEHYWYTMPDAPPYDVESFPKRPCDRPATGTITWLGSHGHPDREIRVCDECRCAVEVQNELEQAKRDGTLHKLLEPRWPRVSDTNRGDDDA